MRKVSFLFEIFLALPSLLSTSNSLFQRVILLQGKLIIPVEGAPRLVAVCNGAMYVAHCLRGYSECNLCLDYLRQVLDGFPIFYRQFVRCVCIYGLAHTVDISDDIVFTPVAFDCSDNIDADLLVHIVGPVGAAV